MHLCVPTQRRAHAGDLDALVATTRVLLDVAGLEPGIYVLEETLDGAVAVVDVERRTTAVLDAITAAVTLLMPNLSFAGMGWAEQDDDEGLEPPTRCFLREIAHTAPTAHGLLASHRTLAARDHAAGTHIAPFLKRLAESRTASERA